MLYVVLRLVLLIVLIACPFVLFSRGRRAEAPIAAIPVVLIVACLSLYYIPQMLEHRRGENYFAGLAEAQPSAPVLKQFLKLYPDAHINYTYFDASGAPGFDVEVGLHDRYELMMQLPAIFDAAGRHVVGYGEPKFYLAEVQSVERLPDGRVQVQYTSTGQGIFGSREWQQIVAHNGDFNAIGYTLKSDQPVAGFGIR